MSFQNWAIDIFEGQFQPDGNGFVYRKSMKGKAIRVTAEERERYIAAYQKSFWNAVWGGVGAMILFAIVDTFFLGDPTEASDVIVWIFVLLLAVFYFFHMNWVFTAPARDLRDRPKIGEPGTRTEARRASLRTMSYRQFATIAVLFPLVVFWDGSWRQLSPEWRMAVWAGVSLLMIGLAFRAYQKWQFERDDKS